MSLRVSLDMTAYITEFILPFWVISEIAFQSFRFIKADSNWILSSIALSGVMCAFFMVALFYSLRKYVKLKPVDNFFQSVATAIYIVVLWFPLAIFIIFKIIFMKNNLSWGKTNHGIAKINVKNNKIKIEKNAEQITKV